MSYKEVRQKVMVLYTTLQLYKEKTGGKNNTVSVDRRHKCMCECVSGRQTRGASRRSAGCCQKRSCPSLSCLLGFLWLPAWTWNPEKERGIKSTSRTTSHDPSDSDPPPLSHPGPSRSPSLTGSSRWPQTCRDQNRFENVSFWVDFIFW